MSEKTLSRTESQMLARWMREHGFNVDWLDLFRLSPFAISEKYDISEEKINAAVRRVAVVN